MFAFGGLFSMARTSAFLGGAVVNDRTCSSMAAMLRILSL